MLSETYLYIHDYQQGQKWLPEKPNEARVTQGHFVDGFYTIKLQISDPTDYARLLWYVHEWMKGLPGQEEARAL